MRTYLFTCFGLMSLVLAACSDSASSGPTTDGGVADASPDADYFAGTSELDVPVPASSRVYVKLATPAIVTPSDPGSSDDWDLAFEGYNVYTNSGASGSGQGGAFGPLPLSDFLSNAPPDVPFTSVDETGGAFLDWYDYDGTTHILYSYFHVYGVKRGSQLWKVQILTYYGEQDNAPTSGIYQIRYADLTSGASATKELTIDGTAGGLSAPATAPSGCLNLSSGNVTQLTLDEIKTSTAWDLCFRRDYISVNGGVSGPGGVGAVDLEASQTSSAQLATVEAETATGELGLFSGVTASSFTHAIFQGDHVVSAFETGGWLDTTSSPPTPVGGAWLVVDASGKNQFLVAFVSFQHSTTSSPGTVVMRIKPVNG